MTEAEELIEQLKGGNVLASSFARVTLMNMGERAVRPLIEAVKKDYANKKLRHSAETILVRIGKRAVDERAVDALIEASKDQDANIRGFAETVLRYIGEK